MTNGFMRTRRGFTLGMLATPWLAGAAHAQGGAAQPAVGSLLPLADVPLLEGGSFSAAQAQGRVVVVYWWASWCPFCAEMSPDIEKLWRTNKDKGLAVLGVSVDRTAEAAIAHRQRKGYTFPSTIVTSAGNAIGPVQRRIPVLWVRGRDGRVAMAETGQMFPEDIEQVARFL